MSKRDDWPKEDNALWLVEPGHAAAPGLPLAEVPTAAKKGTPAPETALPPPCRLCAPNGGLWVSTKRIVKGEEVWAASRCLCARGQWLFAKDQARNKHVPIVGEV